jgi:transcriptional regulator with XRE-family HTH domain
MRPATPFKLELIRLGIAQVDLAKMTGIAESRVSRLVNGHRRPTRKELSRLNVAMGMDVVEFFEDCARPLITTDGNRDSYRDC